MHTKIHLLLIAVVSFSSVSIYDVAFSYKLSYKNYITSAGDILFSGFKASILLSNARKSGSSLIPE